MRFSCDETNWVMDQLHPAQWHFLCELPELAAGKGLGEAAKKSLMPDPLLTKDYGEREKESEFLQDWDEFVKPDLELTFREARARVESDLEEVTTCEGPEFDLPEEPSPEQIAMIEEMSSLTWRRLELDRAGVEDWFSTLNQARIIMNEVHELAEDDARHMNSPVVQEGPVISPERAMLLTQYEFYCVVQSILIDQLMEGG